MEEDLRKREKVFQFTTSQGGRLMEITEGFKEEKLSIHDLTRRSTVLLHITISTHILSIHDLTRRSTPQS